jgi:hypothetical protein
LPLRREKWCDVHGVERLTDALGRLHFDSPLEMRALIETLQGFTASAMAALGGDLLGLYVCGSLIMGDFQPASSDIDFLAVTSQPLDKGDLPRVTGIHANLARKSFGDRLEGSYAAASRLRPWGIEGDLLSVGPETQPTLGPSDYSADNMWALRNTGVALMGAPPESIMPDVDEGTLRTGLRQYLSELRVRSLDTSVEDLSSCLLNMARCMFGIESGRACTKQEAAVWLLAREPELEPGLTAALHVRSGMAELKSHAEAMRNGVAKLALLSGRFLS